jgi:AraC-like DNA-binding protein
LFWIPPDTIHEMEGFAPGMHCPYVHFDLVYRLEFSHWDFSIPEGMTDFTDLVFLMHPPVRDPLVQSLAGRIRGHTNRRVGQLIQDICAEAARAQPFAGMRMSGLLMEIVAEILRGRAGLPVEHMAHIPLLEKTADVMARECASPASVTDLARRCELSPSHFRHLFQRHFGCSPRTYIRRARLRKAQELMVGTAQTLSEIAVQVGFETVHSLSRAFRAEEGLSPTEYRRCAPIHTRVEGRRTPYAR